MSAPGTQDARPLGPRLSRRAFLAATVLSVAGFDAAADCGSCSSPSSAASRGTALVYRGPAACPGCAEAVAHLLETCPRRYRVVYCGPDGDRPLSAETLGSASVYAQPGGGSLEAGWASMRTYADDIGRFVSSGGRYLGFCLGAYLAGRSPGFGLFPGDTSEYTTTAGSGIDTTDDTVVPVTWEGQQRHMFFQDGATFDLDPGSNVDVLARYRNGLPAAIVAAHGTGAVGLVGPHPEADRTWYTGGRTNPDGIRLDLGYDLIEKTVTHPAS